MLRHVWFLSCLLSVALCVAGAGHHLTHFMEHRRKRSLIFQSGGTLKFSIGPSMPVFLGDPVNFRSLVCSFTLQGGQYPQPQTPIYPWTKWEENFTRNLASARQRFDEDGSYQEDISRLFVYTALDSYMGRDCLLQAICVNAQYEYHDVGVITQIVNVILTPGHERLDPVYKEAALLGRSGVDCQLHYRGCAPGSNILQRFMYTV